MRLTADSEGAPYHGPVLRYLNRSVYDPDQGAQHYAETRGRLNHQRDVHVLVLAETWNLVSPLKHLERKDQGLGHQPLSRHTP